MKNISRRVSLGSSSFIMAFSYLVMLAAAMGIGIVSVDKSAGIFLKIFPGIIPTGILFNLMIFEL